MTNKIDDVVESDEEEAANAEYVQPVWIDEFTWGVVLRPFPSEERRALTKCVRRSGSSVVIPKGVWLYATWVSEWYMRRSK